MPKFPYRILGTLFNRNFRNDLNQNFGDIESDIKELGSGQLQALEAASEAETQAIYALEQGDYANEKGTFASDQGTYAQTQADRASSEADRAKANADYIDGKKPDIDKFTGEQTNLQAQVNQLVVDGDSSPEAAQARVAADGFTFTTLKERLDKRDEQLADIAYNPESFKLAPEIDYSLAFTRIMSEIQTNGKGSIILAQGKEYSGDIVISTSNVNVRGKGVLKGKVRVEGQVFSDENYRYNGTHNITINEITVDGEGLRDGITLQYAYGIVIDGVQFKDCLKAISVNTIDYFQHVSRLEINNNHFLNCQYAYYVDRGTSIKFICGDVKFNNNVDESTNNNIVSRINSIHANGQDGLIVSGNALFGGSGLITNIDIDTANFVVISSNNIFAPAENCISIKNSKHLTVNGNNCPWSMEDAILLDNCTAYVITDNNISWYEMTEQPGFIGCGILVQNNQNGYGNISDNTILFPYKQGIKIFGSGKNTIANNTIKNLDSEDEAILVDGEFNYVVGNSCFDFSKKNTVTGFNSVETQTYTGSPTVYSNVTQKLKVKSFVGNETSINIDDADVIIFGNSAPTTVNVISATDLNTPREIKFFSYNANTTLSRATPNLTTYGSSGGLKLESTGSMTFLVANGSLLEINRNNVTPV